MEMTTQITTSPSSSTRSMECSLIAAQLMALEAPFWFWEMDSDLTQLK